MEIKMRVRKDKKGLTMPLASVMNLFVIGMVLEIGRASCRERV